MRYGWRNLSFEAPEGRDESTVLIVDSANPPAYNLAMRVEPMPKGTESLDVYVAAQRPAKGAVVDKRSEREVAGRKAFVVEQHLKADKTILRQQQAFIAEGREILVVTMTARDDASKRARAAFDDLLSSLSWS